MLLLENFWTDAELAKLPVKGGFRLRGLAMTRLETFADAAFAFAVTMLVISIDSIPGNFPELVEALKGIPAFAASFASIMLVWAGHNRWSRRYGLEDGPATLFTLCLIFIMLVFLYPLKLVFSALFAWLSGGWMPSQFAITSGREIAAWSTMSITGVMSAVFALLAPGKLAVYAGFVYFVLPVAEPWLAISYQKKAEALQDHRGTAAE